MLRQLTRHLFARAAYIVKSIYYPTRYLEVRNTVGQLPDRNERRQPQLDSSPLINVCIIVKFVDSRVETYHDYGGLLHK